MASSKLKRLAEKSNGKGSKTLVSLPFGVFGVFRGSLIFSNTISTGA
jgi:hypothetical protein